jgi:hypothetical protein
MLFDLVHMLQDIVTFSMSADVIQSEVSSKRDGDTAALPQIAWKGEMNDCFLLSRRKLSCT